MAISPDGRNSGTNALSLPVPDAIRFRFGQNSFENHKRAAVDAGLAVSIITSPGLDLDLDTPRDLEMLGRPSTSFERDRALSLSLVIGRDLERA